MADTEDVEVKLGAHYELQRHERLCDVSNNRNYCSALYAN